MSQPRHAGQLGHRHRRFFLLCLVSIILCWGPIMSLVRLSVQNEQYTHIALVPFISVGLLWLERRRVFAEAKGGGFGGAFVMAVGIISCWVARSWQWLPGRETAIGMSLVTTWIGAFIECYGMGSFRKGGFALMFLFLAVPPPSALYDQVVAALQAGSAELSYGLFRLAGVPVLKQGLALSLPGLQIEVAPQCSGIRSSVSFLIASLLAGHLFLKAASRQCILVLSVVPIVLFKNAVRIVSLSLLGIYVDREFLFGSLHRNGGLPFSFVGLALLAPLVWLLWRSEKRAGPNVAQLGNAGD